MKKILLTLFTLFLLIQSNIATAQTQFDVNGVIVPREIKFQNKTLQLNGFGTRSKMMIEVYVQALYLTILSQDAKDIIDSNTEMAIRIQITSSMVSSGKLTRNLNKGFELSSKDILDTLLPRMEQLKGMLSDEIVENDVFNLIYNPTDTSIWVYKNDELKGKIAGFDFKKAFFGIWLSDNPVGENLKKNLLGQ
ncbi:chalcone isomerase [Flavobacterium rhamnosiphilum]|uniref:Chalcone isomerase n=1 Tax=Flavobacterium rhamnosiphilum TaxID=2541724 RepID=A0A4R5F4N2_9FLAO|nr:chalcone isomerase family protein [Flavobacterium rhamnosiphilum]TDE42452.1 chalcone isomerase [Flavobacterium rhamnosiphilum]